MGRRHAEVFLDLLKGEGFAQPSPRPMFPTRRAFYGSTLFCRTARAYLVGLVVERDRGLGSTTGHEPAKLDAEGGRERRAAAYTAGKADPALPRRLESRGTRPGATGLGLAFIFALMNDQDRAYFGRGDSSDQIGIIDNMRAVSRLRWVALTRHKASPSALYAHASQSGQMHEMARVWKRRAGVNVPLWVQRSETFCFGARLLTPGFIATSAFPMWMLEF